MTEVVIVVDMQRGFLEEGHPLYCGPEARRVIRPVLNCLEKAVGQGAQLFFTADTHDPGDKEFKMWPPHCLRGSEEAEIIPELSLYLSQGTLVQKRRYSAFFETDLAERLTALQPEKIVICGVCTDICVMHTVADARNRDYNVVVPEDCVASFDPEAHAFALKHMEKILGATIIPSGAES